MTHPVDITNRETPTGMRWDVWHVAHADGRRESLIAGARVKFPTLTEDRVVEAFDKVVVRACGPVGAVGAYPEAAVTGALVFSHLRTCLANELLNAGRRDHAAPTEDEVLAQMLGSGENAFDQTIELHSVLADAREHLDPRTWGYVQKEIAGFTRDEIGHTKRQYDTMRAKWSAWAADARQRLGAWLPIPAFVRSLFRSGEFTAAGGVATAGGSVIGGKLVAGCAAGALCIGVVGGGAALVARDGDSEPSKPSKTATAQPQADAGASVPSSPSEKTNLDKSERRTSKERSARKRRKARSTSRSGTDREFGIESGSASTPTSTSTPAPTASPTPSDCEIGFEC